MENLNFRIETFDPQTASDTFWEEYFAFKEELFRERYPEDPPPPRDVTKSFMLDPNPNVEIFWWLIFTEDEQDQLIGSGMLSFASEASPDYETNRHVARGDIGIGQAYRRQGIGTTFLRTLVAKAKVHGKTILQGGTDFESGRKFCEAHNGVAVIEGKESRLFLSDVDWELIDNWRKEGPQRAAGVTLETFRTVPEKYVQEFAAIVTEVVNQQPRGELEGIDFTLTPERLRADEKRFKEKDIVWITMISKEQDGAMSGLTSVHYLPAEPHRVAINFTGVREPYRGRGLGKWLKAEMLTYLTKTYPDLEYISTDNAATNAPMLSINERMGYKEYRWFRAYKFQISELVEKLGH